MATAAPGPKLTEFAGSVPRVFPKQSIFFAMKEVTQKSGHFGVRDALRSTVANTSRTQTVSMHSAHVNGIEGVPPLDDQSVLQDAVPAILEQQDAMAQNWHNHFQSLQSPSQVDVAAPASRPTVASSQFSTADHSQNIGDFYSAPTTHENVGVNSYVQDPFSMSMPNNSDVSPLTNNTLEASFIYACPSWLIGYEFDLEALNTSVSTTWDTTQPLFQSHLAFQDPQPIVEDQLALIAEAQRRQRSATDQIRKGWFTQIQDKRNSNESRFGTNVGSPAPVAAGEQYEIGDSFRHRISAQLQAPISDEPLPSTRYLNLSVQIYFTKFNQIFPVIHGQTFRLKSKNSLLLLSITSIGSLLLGSKSAAAQGTRIFEKLNKAILANWEQSLHDVREAKSMIQAALIGQTFGLLSGAKKGLAKAEKMPCGAQTRESRLVRTVHGLYIHDAMLSRIFHHEPLLRHGAITVPAAADSELFHAPSASTWKQLMLKQSFPQPALHECLHFNVYSHNALHPTPEELSCRNGSHTAYIVLNGISAFISEKQQTGQLAPASVEFGRYFDALMCWFFTFADLKTPSHIHHKSSPDVSHGMIMVLWHAVLMELVTNFDILERAIGRDGPDSPTAQADLAYARQWANSVEGQRCTVHVDALLYSLGAMGLDTEPAIHIPHSLFMAGIATYSYKSFRQPQHETNEVSVLQRGNISRPKAILDFPEFTRRGVRIPEHLFESTQQSSGASNSARTEINTERGHNHADISNDRFRPNGGIGIGMMCAIIDLLGRIGHW
ncbi:uncharacterized protein PAC_19408 [Phialocephala subalpina]|uniref:Transcription factor domain-containing protein n=1 Tax=Phialocephala subalpina TaxID=576137 RepID=A0A1L7XWX5_9HELO|nr:uncharacterized protein PAC_19408 [Phialocephala subalpina]